MNKHLKESFFRYSALVLVIVALGLFLWKVISESNLRSELVEEKAAVAVKARTALETQAVELLHLSAIPLGWSIRSEMMKGNLEQIGDYLNTFVHERNVSQAMLVRNDGRILVSTDKKLEGQEFSPLFRDNFAAATDIMVDKDENGTLRLVVPIMGYNTKLGMLIVSYDASGLDTLVTAE